MAFRRFFKILLKRTSPLLYASTSMFVNNSEPDSNEKIQWEPPDFSKFTHEYMIKQSTVDTVNSVSKALTITYNAIETASEEYRRSLAMLMSLIRDTLAYRVGDSHWDMIVAARSEVQRTKKILTQLVGYMDYVQKMGIATTEASYMAGMDNLSTTLAQRMDDALNKMNREVKSNEIIETEYNLLQEQCIKKSKIDETSKKDENNDIKVETILVD